MVPNTRTLKEANVRKSVSRATLNWVVRESYFEMMAFKLKIK